MVRNCIAILVLYCNLEGLRAGKLYCNTGRCIAMEWLLGWGIVLQGVALYCNIRSAVGWNCIAKQQSVLQQGAVGSVLQYEENCIAREGLRG